MKLNKTQSAFLLLVLISFNIIVSNCELIKNTRSRKTRSSYKRSKLTRSYSKSKSKNFILDTLKTVLLDPINIIYFTLGVVSEFASGAEVVYRKIKPIVDVVQPCFEIAKAAYHKYKANEANKELTELRKLESIELLEEKLAKEEHKKEYCEKTKEEISENFLRASWELMPNKGGIYNGVFKLTPDVILILAAHIAKEVVSKKEFCARPTYTDLAPKTSAQLKGKFKSLDEYYKQCMYFNNLDCSVFSPETSKVWAFIKSAWGYLSLAKEAGTCIANLITGPNADKRLSNIEGANDIFGSLLKNGLATVIGVVANFITFGAWGGIKGGYYLIQLALDIKKFYDDVTEDLPFLAGKLVGKGILIAKSFLLGKKKIRRMK